MGIRKRHTRPSALGFNNEVADIWVLDCIKIIDAVLVVGCRVALLGGGFF